MAGSLITDASMPYAPEHDRERISAMGRASAGRPTFPVQAPRKFTITSSAPLARTSTPEVLIGGKPAEVTFAGLTPGLAGVYQVNATVPSGLRPGRQTVSWRIGGATSNGCGTIAVR